jgi:hypothetical protein
MSIDQTKPPLSMIRWDRACNGTVVVNHSPILFICGSIDCQQCKITKSEKLKRNNAANPTEAAQFKPTIKTLTTFAHEVCINTQNLNL